MAEGGGGDLKFESAPYDNKGAAQVTPPVTDLVRKSIVFINAPSIKGPAFREYGSGSIVKFKDKPWLMTCAHVIPTKEFAKKSCIFFDKVSGTDDEESIDYTGEELLDFESAPLIDEDLDVALFAIKSGEVPKLDGGKQRLELDLSSYQQDGSDCSAKEKDLVKLWHYPSEGKFSLQSSSYVVLAVSGTRFSHGAETHPGSSGAPVFKSHGKMEVLVGLHRCSLTKSSPVGLNVATHIHAIWCLLSKEEHGLGVPNLDVLGLKGSGKEGSSEVPHVKSESSAQKLQRPPAAAAGQPKKGGQVISISDLLPFLNSMLPHLELLGPALGNPVYARAINDGQGSIKYKCRQILEDWLDNNRAATWDLLVERLISSKVPSFTRLIAEIQEAQQQQS